MTLPTLSMTDISPHTELQSLLRQHLADQEALRLAADLLAQRCCDECGKPLLLPAAAWAGRRVVHDVCLAPIVDPGP
jgi:tRNA A37 threonylcarbamoyladenosine synthetase subunit TsaC/SUA5/YrdC